MRIRNLEVAWPGSSVSGFLRRFKERSAEAAGPTSKGSHAQGKSNHSALHGMEGFPRI